MADNSKIEWTESTWNPVTGCTKISKGCLNCYAEKLSLRLREMGQTKYKNGFKVSLHPEEIYKPLTWKKPRVIFVNSMSDLFHNKIPFSFIKSVFDTMNRAEQHVFQVLTKRSSRLVELAPKLNWSNNILMGVTVESSEYVFRVNDLISTPAKIKFLSIEPLLSPIPRIPLKGIDWIIVGGESGKQARPVQAEWIREIRNKCIQSNVPFFFKQWGGVNKKINGRLLDGKIWDDTPSIMNRSYQSSIAFNVTA